MWQVGENCSRNDWKELAVEILLYGTKRKEAGNTKIEDACLCHGSSGLSLIYYHAWLKTGRKEFYNSARYWGLRTLNYADKHGEYTFRGLNGFETRYNLLEGIAGVGLYLMVMLEGYLPGWEKALLIG